MRRYEKFSNGAIYFNRKVVESFVRCLGIYPVGTLVRLSNDRLGVIKTIKHNNILAPVVVIVYDAKSDMKLKPKTVDLEEYNLKRSENPVIIKQIEDPREWQIVPERYLDEA